MKLLLKSIIYFLSGIHSLNILDGAFVPAEKLDVPWDFPNNGPGPVYDNFINSVISSCSELRVIAKRCACPEKYNSIYQRRNRRKDTYVLITTDDVRRQLVVSYISTLSVRNVLTDVNTPMVTAPGLPEDILVHKGSLDYFAFTHREAKGIVNSLLKSKRYSNYTLHITGYSLGAAIATVATPHWFQFVRKRKFNNPFQVYTYAGPRVGNDHFAEHIASLDIPMIRYTNKHDGVSNLPPRVLGYHHVGLEFHLQRKSKGGPYYIEPCSQRYDEDPHCGLSEPPILPTSHAMPFNKILPIPPYC